MSLDLASTQTSLNIEPKYIQLGFASFNMFVFIYNKLSYSIPHRHIVIVLLTCLSVYSNTTFHLSMNSGEV